VRAHFDFVCSLLRSAVELGDLKAMPGSLPPRPRRPRKLPDCPSLEEIHAVLQVARGWVRTAIALGIFAGLRSGEIRALVVADVDLVVGSIHVRRAMSCDQEGNTKGDSDRIVPIVPELASVLEQACRGKLPMARVVVNAKGKTPRRQAVWDALDRLQKRAGLRHRSVHALRHGFCTHLLRRGIDAESVRTLAGHTNLATTERYLHADPARARALMTRAMGGQYGGS
jgi:integrase